MARPKTLPAFTPKQRELAHKLLATRVAFMMGRKFEEGDWASVYCKAKEIPNAGWSNLNIDVMHAGLGVEHKMMCYRSKPDLSQAMGETFMHPAATRSIRVPPLDSDPNDAMKIILEQYGELIEARRRKVKETAPPGVEADMRTGWLLWQDSLRQFLYFEEEMIAPNPADFYAKWVESEGRGDRKGSKNLWIYEKATDQKRYSVTTSAGAKIQPYFDVPGPKDPNVYLFTVIGEVIGTDFVRVWLSEATARELRKLLGDLSTEKISTAILETVAGIEPPEKTAELNAEVAEELTITVAAYSALTAAMPGVNDDHCFQLLAAFLREKMEKK